MHGIDEISQEIRAKGQLICAPKHLLVVHVSPDFS